MTLPEAAAPIDLVVMRAAAIAEQGWPIGPRPMPCVCGRELAVHLAGLPPGCSGYVHDPADALALEAVESADRGVVQDLIENGDAEHAARRKLRPPGPRVSDAGSCRRQVWYRECPPDGYTPGPTDRRAAAIGTAIHEAAARARAARYPWRMYEFEVPVPGLDSVPRVDEYDPVLGRVTDDKTAGDRKWELVGEDGPSEDAWRQVLIYAYALDHAGWPVREVQIIVIRRSDGREEPFTRPYDPAQALQALDDLIELATVLELGIEPPRDGRGPSDWRCAFCPALAHCWNIPQAQAAGRSPESYTLLGAEPEHAAIEWAAERAHTLAKQLTDLEKEAKAAKALLDGVKPGTYGNWVVGRTTRKMPEYKATHLRNLGWLALDPQHRPPYESWQDPERRLDSYVSIKPVRAAKRTGR